MEIPRRRNFHTAHGLGNLRWEHRKDFLIKYFHFFFAFLVHFEEWNLKRLKKSKTEIGVKATNHSGEKECRKEKLKITAQECEKISVVFRLDRGSMFVFLRLHLFKERKKNIFVNTFKIYVSAIEEWRESFSWWRILREFDVETVWGGHVANRSIDASHTKTYTSWHSLNDLNLDCIIRCKFTTKLLETVEAVGERCPQRPSFFSWIFHSFPRSSL